MKTLQYIYPCLLLAIFPAVSRAGKFEDQAWHILETQGVNLEAFSKISVQTRNTFLAKQKELIAKSNLPPEATLKRLKTAEETAKKIDEAFSPKRLKALFIKFMTDNLTHDELSEVSDFVSHPAGVKFMKLPLMVKDYSAHFAQEVSRPIIEELRKNDNAIIVEYGGQPLVYNPFPAPPSASQALPKPVPAPKSATSPETQAK